MHVRALAAPLRDVDVRKAASALTTLANEKQKEQRDKAGGKKKGANKPAKPALGGAKSVARCVRRAGWVCLLYWLTAHAQRRHGRVRGGAGRLWAGRLYVACTGMHIFACVTA
jgi:hypothetical protein